MGPGMSAPACAAKIAAIMQASSMGPPDPSLLAPQIAFWTKILIPIFAEVCNATVVTNPGQACTVTVSSAPGTAAGTTNAPGTASIVA